MRTFAPNGAKVQLAQKNEFFLYLQMTFEEKIKLFDWEIVDVGKKRVMLSTKKVIELFDEHNKEFFLSKPDSKEYCFHTKKFSVIAVEK